MCVFQQEQTWGAPASLFNPKESGPLEQQPSNVEVTLNAVLSIGDGCHVMP